MPDENHGILDEDGEIHCRLSKDYDENDEDDDDYDYDENNEDVDEDSEHVNDCEVADEDDKVVDKDCDQIYDYACEVLSLALIWHSYHHAVKEGDG